MDEERQQTARLKNYGSEWSRQRDPCNPLFRSDGFSCFFPFFKIAATFDGIGNVPEKYGTVEGRKVVEDSKNIIDLVKNPNKFFFIIVGVILLLLAILAGIIMIIRKFVKRLKNK